MPEVVLAFRAVCGGFVAALVSFMRRRAAKRKPAFVRTLKLRIEPPGGVAVGLLLACLYLGVFLLRRCGDVELNPGPRAAGTATNQKEARLSCASTGSAGSQSASSAPSGDWAMKEASSSRQGLNSKFGRLEKDVKEVKAMQAGLLEDVASLREEVRELNVETQRLKAGTQTLYSWLEPLERQTDEFRQRSETSSASFLGAPAGRGDETRGECDVLVKDVSSAKPELLLQDVESGLRLHSERNRDSPTSVKRLLPGGVCARTPDLQVGDRLLECNGHSLQGLTQARCLDVLKAAGPRVTLTLLHEKEDNDENPAGVPKNLAKSRSPREPPRQQQRPLSGAGERRELVGEGKKKEGVGAVRRVTSSSTVSEKKEEDVPKSGAVSVNGGGSVVSRTERTTGTGSSKSSHSVSKAAAKNSGLKTVPDSTSSKDDAVRDSSSSGRQLRQEPSPRKPPDDMSNPFLDPDPLGDEDKRQQSQNHEDSGLNSSNPFYSDVVLGGAGGAEGTGVGDSNPFYQDVVLGGEKGGQVGVGVPQDRTDSLTLVDAQDENGEGRVVVEDVLLDFGEPDGGAGMSPSVPSPAAGNVDLLSGLSASPGEADVNIPPPMEFSDLGDVTVLEKPSSRVNPPASDDLLDWDFTASVESAARAKGGKVSGSSRSGSNGSEDGFDFLLDVGEARQPAAPLLMDIAEEEQQPAQLSPPHPPRPVPRSSQDGPAVTDGELGLTGEVDVGSEVKETVAATVSAVTSSQPSSGESMDHGINDGPTQMQVQVNGKEPVLKSSLPADAFLPTSVGVSKKLSGSPSSGAGAEQEEEEEEITPMKVHRDHQGNKLAAPSSVDGAAKAASGPRKLDEAAKQGLQTIMSQMTTDTRRARDARQNGTDEDRAHVTEEEIVPVKLTRKEAETAGEVLSKWMSDPPKASTSSRPLPSRTSGFQKVVGTVVDVQAGRKDLPGDRVFLTTMGVTRTPAPDGQDVEEEIKPMSVHKDHMGHKHFAPSPLESKPKPAASRQLDHTAKKDIAALMSAMPDKAKKSQKAAEDYGASIEEEAITPTVLSKNAMEVVTKWLNRDEDADRPQTKPSAFQRLVKDVVHQSSKADDEEVVENNREELARKTDERDIKEREKRKEPVEESFTPSRTVSTASSAPTPRPKPQPSAQNRTADGASHPPPTTSTTTTTTTHKPPPPPVMPKPSIAERKKVFSDEVDHAPSPRGRGGGEGEASPRPATRAGTTTNPALANLRPVQKEDATTKPVPIQRTLRGPGKITPALSSQTSSTLSMARPLAKIGTLSVSGRTVTPSLLGSRTISSSSSSSTSSSLAQYGRTRSEESPFLVEVLKGIVGLGIKVKVTGEGHVEVTEVQRNGPVAKNGNVRVGDYLLSVNGTELQGLTESRVQQVLRLLPRVLVKLVVSARPPLPADSQKPDNPDQPSSGEASPRSAASVSQYGVRLSPRPYSSTSSDGQPEPPPDGAPSQPLNVDADQDEEDDDEDMATRKLSKALSPRSSQEYHPEAPSPPKPSPRQRLVSPSAKDEHKAQETVDSSAADTPRKAERQLTVSEIVAAASRRPSGRDDDLPQPPPVCPPGEATVNDDGGKAPESSSKRPSNIDPVLEVSRAPSGIGTDREDVPVFAAAARNVSSDYAPSPKSRSLSENRQDGLDSARTPRKGFEKEAERKTEVEEVVQAQSAHVQHAAAPPPVAAKPKIPPPVAPKPKRTSSGSSDKSHSSVHSDEAPKDLPSPTLVSSKLKDFADAGGAPAAEDSSQSRKFVSSAARMFERKATEAKPVSPLTRPTRSSVPVSSVVKSFNRGPDSESSSKSEVVMRRVSMGVSGHDGGGGEGEDGKRLNSALLPPSERRKSTPSRFSGSSSLQLTKPSSLSHLRHQPPAKGGPAISEEEEGDKASPRFNSALRPRHGFSTSSSLKSVISSREQKEEKQPASARANKESDTADVTYRSRLSDASPRDVTPRKHASWSSQTGDSHSSTTTYSSSSLHHTPRYGTAASSSSSSSSWAAEHSDNLESTMKKFDDLLSDKHIFDSDEELPKVSNSVSLDLLKNRNAGKVAATMKSSEQQAAAPAARDSTTSVNAPESQKNDVSAHKAPSEEPSENSDVVKDKGVALSQPTEAFPTVAPPADGARSDEVSSKAQAPVEEESAVVTVQTTESSPVEKTSKAEPEEKAEKEDRHFQRSEPDVQSQTTAQSSQQSEVSAQHLGSWDQKSNRESKQMEAVSEHSRDKPHPEPPQRKPRQPRQVLEDAEDVYPEADSAAPLSLPETEHTSPEEQAAAVNVSQTEDEYPNEDTALSLDVAQDTIYHQQASTIVHTVISNALKDVASRPKHEKASEEEDNAPAPPLPAEEPPPLPGAPPPPLILRNTTDTLINSEDLEGMLPSQGGSPAKSSPRSQPAGSSTEVSPRNPPTHVNVLESEDVELQIEETVHADTAVSAFAAPPQQKEPVSQAEENAEPVGDSDVLISFQSSSPQPPVLIPSIDLTGGLDLPGKGGELDQAKEEHPPVSDTLSQDSGVQDEDMSEDGLRFSHDESPTSQGDSSLFDTAITPEELPHRVTKESELVEEEVSHVSKSPVPSPRSRVPPPTSPRSHPPSLLTPNASQATRPDEDVQNGVGQQSHPAQGSLSVQGKLVQDVHVQSADPTQPAVGVNRDIMNNDSVHKDGVHSDSLGATDAGKAPEVPPEPKTAPAPPPAQEDDESGESDSAEVKSPRKWCILDQSGSLFLHGEAKSSVKVRRQVLRQVSSMHPGELADMLAAANKDLDEAHHAQNVELRVVGARTLTGRTLNVEVNQREDYLVQVTRVHSKESPLQDGDLLMFVDGHTLKNRRPAQVHSQLESTGPKGVLLTARGVKLPASLARLQEDRSSDSNSNPASPRSVASPTPSAPCVQVGPGVYDVVMVKGATGVGFCLEGGRGSPRGDLPILIKRIFKGGPAEKCGQLKVKDEIMAVNGVDFSTMGHYEAWNHLKFLDDGEIHLRIRRQED